MGGSTKQQQLQQEQQQPSGESVYAMSDAAQQKEIDRLSMKLRQLESKLASEEKARAAAQVTYNVFCLSCSVFDDWIGTNS